jgi:hypothetical protein
MGDGMGIRPLRVLGALALGIVVSAATGTAAERTATVRSGHRRTAARQPRRVSRRGPGVAVPELVLTGGSREERAVEARLAAFVRAVRYLSRQTDASVRGTVARRDWPWRTAPRDLGPLFARPRLRLLTVALRPDRARVRIAPPGGDPNSLEAAGFYDVNMVREGPRWQVMLPVDVTPGARLRRKR